MLRSIAWRALKSTRRAQHRHVRFYSDLETDQNPIQKLKSRDLLQAATSSAVESHLATEKDGALVPRTIYAGVDPSAASMHVGNLLPLLALLHCSRYGHTGLVLVGGGTGAIGDPSGRSTERSALDLEQLEANVASIRAQMYQFFHNAAAYLNRRHGNDIELNPYTPDHRAEPTGERLFSAGLDIRLVNNTTWLQPVSIIEFLSNVGRHARVNDMLARDSVKSRMNLAKDGKESTEGLSFTEFTYQLLQAYDFSVLHREPYHCSVQIGGSDQMGNIAAGIDLIRRQEASKGKSIQEDPAYGLTLPLLTTANGTKFGKSAGNAVWLSPKHLSDLDFYQYFLRTSDADVGRFLRSLTLLPIKEIESVMAEHEQQRSKKRAQEVLATEMTELVRGEQAVFRARVATKVLFGSRLEELRVGDVITTFQNDPRLQTMPRSILGTEIVNLAADSQLTTSKGEARRLQKGGGLYLNNISLTDANRPLLATDLLNDRFIVLRAGKQQHRIIVVEET
ncbi:tyrosine--tRNA ligase [Malassezia yamatoensis]|uniref:tyrosine--tRNA ligase n=1 Tax=Malassezia yamatoensis TaxID=253288 RepID=A0AAJ5YW02_9BASI|nr:tyrosine--tRNA ligase [Malassezia yamatoensis]